MMHSRISLPKTILSTIMPLITLWMWALTSHGATIIVPPPPASIQTAINSALPGDHVQLSPGTYIEEIYINKDIILGGSGIDVSIIQAPTSPNPLNNTFVFTPTGATYHSIVLVENTANVIIHDLTIDGNSQPENFLSNRFDGLAYHNAGGTINNVRSTNVRDSNPAGGTQHGFAIAAAVDNGITYTLNVTNSVVDNFQKAGIDVRGATLIANINNNIVTGQNPPSIANANGIVGQFGVLANIDSNTVSDLVSTVIGVDTVGILLIGEADNSTITNNTTSANNIGIYSSGALGDITVSGNNVFDNTNIGAALDSSSGITTVENNIFTDNVNANLYLSDTVNRAFNLANNQFNGSQVGLQVEGNGPNGPVVTMNADEFVGSTVYYIQEINAPNDIWPSTASVYFDGLISGHITLAEYNQIRTKILDQRSPVLNLALGLVLDFIVPSAPVVTDVTPDTGPNAGGNVITITGLNFISSNTEVFFGAVPGTNVIVNSDTSITVTVPAGTGTVDVTVVTPIGTSEITEDDEYTYLIDAPLNFRGRLRCKVLTARWDESPSESTVAYRIYKAGVLVKTVAADAPRIFISRKETKKSAKTYSITAVDGANNESEETFLRLEYINKEFCAQE